MDVMNWRQFLHAAAAGVAMLAGPRAAHAASYDLMIRVKITGVVSKVEWTNPHARFYVDVPEPDGTVTTWNLELASPSALARNGWTSRVLRVGDTVTVEGYSGRVVPTRGSPRSVLLADGRSLFAGVRADQDAPDTVR